MTAGEWAESLWVPMQWIKECERCPSPSEFLLTPHYSCQFPLVILLITLCLSILRLTAASLQDSILPGRSTCVPESTSQWSLQHSVHCDSLTSSDRYMISLEYEITLSLVIDYCFKQLWLFKIQKRTRCTKIKIHDIML